LLRKLYLNFDFSHLLLESNGYLRYYLALFYLVR
jgi:hypothetical protein